MELFKLQQIVRSLDTLADVEREHPVIGSKLLAFFGDVRTSCDQAYGRLSKALMSVLSLPAEPSQEQLDEVAGEIIDAPNSKWFREVAGVCDRLAMLSAQYEPQLNAQIDHLRKSAFIHPTPTTQDTTPSYDKMILLGELVDVLQRHEGDLKDDIRHAVYRLVEEIGKAKTSGYAIKLKEYAQTVQDEIRASNDQIAKLSLQIEGGSSEGAEAILTSGLTKDEGAASPTTVHYHYGDVYKDNVGAAFGPNATATNTNITVWKAAESNLDLTTLIASLETLRPKLNAADPKDEHAEERLQVLAAEKAAKDGDKKKVLQHLKAAGKWVLEVATKIGEDVAAKVITSAIGLPG